MTRVRSLCRDVLEGGKKRIATYDILRIFKKKKKKEIQRQRANRKPARLMKTTTVRGWRASLMLRMLRDKHRANTRGALKPIIRAFCLGVHTGAKLNRCPT